MKQTGSYNLLWLETTRNQRETWMTELISDLFAPANARTGNFSFSLSRSCSFSLSLSLSHSLCLSCSFSSPVSFRLFSLCYYDYWVIPKVILFSTVSVLDSHSQDMLTGQTCLYRFLQMFIIPKKISVYPLWKKVWLRERMCERKHACFHVSIQMYYNILFNDGCINTV